MGLIARRAFASAGRGGFALAAAATIVSISARHSFNPVACLAEQALPSRALPLQQIRDQSRPESYLAGVADGVGRREGNKRETADVAEVRELHSVPRPPLMLLLYERLRLQPSGSIFFRVQRTDMGKE